jgi:hypothetical protein
MRPVRTGATSDRVQLVEPLGDAHGAGQRPNGFAGRVPVPTMTLFVSR